MSYFNILALKTTSASWHHSAIHQPLAPLEQEKVGFFYRRLNCRILLPHQNDVNLSSDRWICFCTVNILQILSAKPRMLQALF